MNNKSNELKPFKITGTIFFLVFIALAFLGGDKDQMSIGVCSLWIWGLLIQITHGK
ncbi:hypothetical protein LASUN_13200 [Lentilactobacillus sunkii]|uniref:Uncharacterized protein n=1 Tax=Lentilactobacillus sunkii TaxID=481719 RepID=A0A1E7XCC2_9LACO|nr:hypothetical protein [Lentilactobacillus sunkii]OFA10770.1 hypothetical protein LASUN_13200 [Lentilactobacillus sunkii]